MDSSRSSPGPLDLVAQLLQLTYNALRLVALHFDAPVLDRAPRPAPLFELGGEFPQPALVQGEVEYGGHALPPPACRLPPDLGSDRLLGRLGGCFARLCRSR